MLLILNNPKSKDVSCPTIRPTIEQKAEKSSRKLSRTRYRKLLFDNINIEHLRKPKKSRPYSPRDCQFVNLPDPAFMKHAASTRRLDRETLFLGNLAEFRSALFLQVRLIWAHPVVGWK